MEQLTTENGFTLFTGDCIEVMKTLPDNSVDSIVTDPPYELGFMGKSWDKTGIANNVEMWQEAMRVLKPGGHLLAFSGSRTYHRMTCAIEDAGFEIRDQIMWVYGSGFPKSLDVSKAIDKAAGAEREVVGTNPNWRDPVANSEHHKRWNSAVLTGDITEPATDAAKQWQGWGTALKPAHEPICVARKPLIGTVAANVLAHGTGALNIDGCRVDGSPKQATAGRRTVQDGDGWAVGNGGSTYEKGTGAVWTNEGRWPANIIHDGSAEVVKLFPDSKGSGPARTLKRSAKADNNGWGMNTTAADTTTLPDAGTGSAARFFKQCDYNGEIDCLDLSLALLNVETAGANLYLQNVLEFIVQNDAATSEALEGKLLSVPQELSTNVTVRELNKIVAAVIETIQNIGQKSWHDSQHEKRFQTSNLVNVVVQRNLTAITTITVSHWRLDGSAEPATFSIMPKSLEVGEKGYEQLSGRRFIYCAKTNKKDRGEGNKHPTVKPTDLMRYLVRLVTPPEGVVLDPFMGSGSTGKACALEGMQFIGIDMMEEYVAIAKERIEGIEKGTE